MILLCVRCGGGQWLDVNQDEMVVVVFCKGDGMGEYDSRVQAGKDGLVGRHRCGENC